MEIACSLYIDDRLNSELFANKGYWSKPISKSCVLFIRESAEAALFIVCRLLVHLGYFLGLKKCVLVPVNCITHLGMEVNSSLQAFQIPEFQIPVKRGDFKRGPTVPLTTLQRFMRKAVYFLWLFRVRSLSYAKWQQRWDRHRQRGR